MSGTHSEFTRQFTENKSHTERNGSIKIDPGLTQMLELANKCIKTVIIGLLVLRWNCLVPPRFSPSLTNENP